jgi:ABC-type glycerol-3-phosphate transport system substrate-binding protein
MRRTIALLALVGAAALPAGGCGGGGGSSSSSSSTTTTTTASSTTTSTSAAPLTKAVYARRMKAIGTDLTNSINGVNPSTAAEAATSLVKVQADLRAAQRELAAMTPPADVVIAHRNLTAAVGEFADELDPVIAKLRAGKLAALQTVGQLAALQKIGTATAAIAAAGYNIAGN